jgi:hypothetical protein
MGRRRAALPLRGLRCLRAVHAPVLRTAYPSSPKASAARRGRHMHGQFRPGDDPVQGTRPGELASAWLAPFSSSFSCRPMREYRARASPIETPSRLISITTIGSASNSSRENSVRKAISLLLTGDPLRLAGKYKTIATRCIRSLISTRIGDRSCISDQVARISRLSVGWHDRLHHSPVRSSDSDEALQDIRRLRCRGAFMQPAARPITSYRP